MQSKNKPIVTANDMKLISRILPYTNPSNIPLSFKLGDKTIKGIPASFHPVVSHRILDCNMVQYIIEGKRSGLIIRAEYIEYRDFPVTEWVVFLKNEGKKDTKIISDVRIGGHLQGRRPVLTHGNGDTWKEDGYFVEDTPVKEPLHLSPYSGTSCQGAAPYMTLHFSDCEVRCAIGWPSKWIADITPKKGGVSFLCGQDRCHTVLKPGEVWRTPRLNLMIYEAKDQFRGINLWRRWYFAHILPRENGQPLKPQLIVHHMNIDGHPEFTGATEDNQIMAMKEYIRRDFKPDIWWVDAGWYPCDYHWTHVGTWKPDPQRFPNGLAPIGKECDKNGIKFLLWFEPERVLRGQELDVEHPDWILWNLDRDEKQAQYGLLDLSNPEALDYISKTVNKLIKDSHVRIYRQDFNFDPLPIWEKNEAPDRIGSIENRHMQGYLAYWDSILLENPGLWIDSCASGGRRNDLETMRRAVPLHYTDVGYGNHPIKQKQHRAMFEWIPYFRAHTSSWDDPNTGSYDNCIYGSEHPQPLDSFACHNAITPAITSTCTYNDTEEHMDVAKKMSKIWRKAAEIELCGDYYPMTECREDAHDWYAMQFDDAEHKQGFVQVIRNTLVEEDTFTVKLPCVHNGKNYFFINDENPDLPFIFSSKEVRQGFDIQVPSRSGVILFYTISE